MPCSYCHTHTHTTHQTGLLAQFESLTEVQKRGALTVFNSALVNLTSPRVGGLFPSDLATSLEAVTTSVSLQTSVNIAELVRLWDSQNS